MSLVVAIASAGLYALGKYLESKGSLGSSNTRFMWRRK